MLSYCLKCRKVKILNLQGQKTEELWFYQNVQCVIMKNQTSSISKKLMDY